MQQYYNINQIVFIGNLKYQINSEILYYLRQKGLVKGLKKRRNNTCLYLIEFSNYNRIWFTINELKIIFKKD